MRINKKIKTLKISRTVTKTELYMKKNHSECLLSRGNNH